MVVDRGDVDVRAAGDLAQRVERSLLGEQFLRRVGMRSLVEKCWSPMRYPESNACLRPPYASVRQSCVRRLCLTRRKAKKRAPIRVESSQPYRPNPRQYAGFLLSSGDSGMDARHRRAFHGAGRTLSIIKPDAVPRTHRRNLFPLRKGRPEGRRREDEAAVKAEAKVSLSTASVRSSALVEFVSGGDGAGAGRRGRGAEEPRPDGRYQLSGSGAPAPSAPTSPTASTPMPCARIRWRMP